MTVRYDQVSGECTGGPQIGLIRLREYVTVRWGGDDANIPGDDGVERLGIYACRNVRGGTNKSMHSEGRAWDARFASRAELDEAIGLLLDHAEALRVQEIIDYDAQRRWDSRRGWDEFVAPSPGGFAWHVTRNWDGARDTRPIARILGDERSSAVPIENYPYDPTRDAPPDWAREQQVYGYTTNPDNGHDGDPLWGDTRPNVPAARVEVAAGLARLARREDARNWRMLQFLERQQLIGEGGVVDRVETLEAGGTSGGIGEARIREIVREEIRRATISPGDA